MGFWTNRADTVYAGELGRHATPKHELKSHVITREETKATKKLNDKTFRDAVWKRDGSKCRATGVPLSRSGTDPHRVGEVDHTLLRSTDPDKIYDVTNGVLLSKYLNRLRKVRCRHNPTYLRFDYTAIDPADPDRGHLQRFVWRDDEGVITREVVN
jgi:hypothetical protein